MTKPPQDDDFLTELSEAYSGVKGTGTPNATGPSGTSGDFASEVEAYLRQTKSAPVTQAHTPIHVPGTPTNSSVGASHPAHEYYGGGPVGGYNSGVGKVWIQHDEKTLDGPYQITYGYRDWWDEAIKYYTPQDKAIIIPKDRVSFTYGAVKFNACVFTATDDYLAARWGRKLHTTDRDWMAEHQLSTDDGVPMEYMALVVHAMLEPYGMGVSAIRVRKGSLSAGDGLLPFISALGVNPFALIDRETSNAQAAEKLGMTLAEANKLWRVEFHDDPLPGCTIIGEKGWTSGSGVQTGSFGGHSRYLSPRARPGNWAISIALAPLEQIDYLVPVDVPEYKPRKGEPTLNLDSIRTPDGNAPVAVRVQGTYYSPAEAAERRANGGTKPSVGFHQPSSQNTGAPTTSAAGPTGSTPIKVGVTPKFRASQMKPFVAIKDGPPWAGQGSAPKFGTGGCRVARSYAQGFVRIEATDIATGQITTTISVDSMNPAAEGTLPPTHWIDKIRGLRTSEGHIIPKKPRGRPKKDSAAGFTAVESILREHSRAQHDDVSLQQDLRLVPDDLDADDTLLTTQGTSDVPASGGLLYDEDSLDGLDDGIDDGLAAEARAQFDGDTSFGEPDYDGQLDQHLIAAGTAETMRCSGPCNRDVPWTELVNGTDICIDCYDAFWVGYICPNPKCKTDFSHGFTPWFEERISEQGRTKFSCPSAKCKQVIVVRDTNSDPQQASLIALAALCPDMQAADFEEMKEEAIEYLRDAEEAVSPALLETGTTTSASESTLAAPSTTPSAPAAPPAVPIPQRAKPLTGGQFAGLTQAQLMILQLTYQEEGSAGAKDELNRMTEDSATAATQADGADVATEPPEPAASPTVGDA